MNLHSLNRWLRQPFPFTDSWKEAAFSALWGGTFVMFFLFVFKPFGTTVPDGKEAAYLIACALFGLVTVVIAMLIFGITRIFSRTFEEERWTVGKEIIFNLAFIGCIGIGNLLLAHELWGAPLTFRSFWVWQLLTFAVGLFPTLAGAFWGQTKMNRKYAAEAARLNPVAHAHTDSGDTRVNLEGENQNERLLVPASAVIHIVAADNYVRVYYRDQGQTRNIMLRSTLKKIEDALSGHPQFFRCHRTHLINLDLVNRISGNAQGYRLHLDGLADSVPVSRNLNETVQQLFRDNS